MTSQVIEEQSERQHLRQIDIPLETILPDEKRVVSTWYHFHKP